MVVKTSDTLLNITHFQPFDAFNRIKITGAIKNKNKKNTDQNFKAAHNIITYVLVSSGCQ